MGKSILDLPIDEVRKEIIEAIKTDKVLPELEMLKERYWAKPMFGKWVCEEWSLPKQVFNLYFEYLDNPSFPFLEGESRKEYFIKKIIDSKDPRDNDLFRGFPASVIDNKKTPVDCFGSPFLIGIDRKGYKVYGLECESEEYHPKKDAEWDLLVFGFTGFYLVNRLGEKSLSELFHEHFNTYKDEAYKKLDAFKKEYFNEVSCANEYLEKERIIWKNCLLMDYLNPKQKERIEFVWGELERYILNKKGTSTTAKKVNAGEEKLILEADHQISLLPTYMHGVKKGEEQYYKMAIDNGYMSLNDDRKTYTWHMEKNALAAFFGMFYIGDFIDREGNYVKNGIAQGCSEFSKLFSVSPKSLKDARKEMSKRQYKDKCDIVDVYEMVKKAKEKTNKGEV